MVIILIEIFYNFQGTEKVLSISLGTGEVDELYLHENAFRGMRNLRFLKVYSSSRLDTIKLQLPESFDYLPPKLKLLRWDEYPMRCMPSKFRPENLVELKMENSKLEKLWEGIVVSFENNCYANTNSEIIIFIFFFR